MSKISYPRLVNDIADAYRTASGTANRVKYGELPERIAELPSGPRDNGKIVANAAIAPLSSVKLDISYITLSLTGTTDGKAAANATLGLQCEDLDLSNTAKQWKAYFADETPENMMVSDAGTVLCTLSGRVYRKSRNGAAYLAYMYSSGGYSGPLLVSDVSADAVIFNGGGPDQYSPGTIQYEGKTYWYSSGGYFMGGDCTDTSDSNRYKLTEITTVENGAKLLLDVLSEYWWQDIEGENGDTYTVARDDAKIRCTVTGIGDFTGTAKSDTAIIE